MVSVEQKHQRLLINEQVKECRNILKQIREGRKNFLFTDNEKTSFRNLGITTKFFLSLGKDTVTINSFAKDYLNLTISLVRRLFFTYEAVGFRIYQLEDAIDSIERVADEHFGTVEEAIKVEDVVEDEKRSVSIWVKQMLITD